MRSRDVSIPITLWICAAICAHFVFGTGGLVAARVHDDRSELWKLSRRASGLANRAEGTVEISLGESADDAQVELPAPAPPPKPIPVPKPPTKAAETRPPPPKPQDEKRTLVVKAEDPKKNVVQPDPVKDQRIAVRQHAKADQQDNPTAKFIADDANRVENETRATQTSHDRDDESPSPGATHRGSDDRQPGDSDKTHVADSDEHKGEKNRAPGERGDNLDVQKEPKIPKAAPDLPTKAASASAPSVPHLASEEARPSSPQAPQAPPQPTPGGVAQTSHEVQDAPRGTWTFNPRQAGAPDVSTPQPSGGGVAAILPRGRLWSLPGLGQSAAPGGFNANLSQGQIASIVGSETLARMREADGERRKSEHRGSFVASNFERWRNAIENYATSVKEGNQTALNTARVPFASYLNGMHNRIHPIFADSFLGSLDHLPREHPLNNQTLVTRLEIVLTKEGRLKKMGVVKTSGITAFDIAALDAVDRAQPYGPAPNAIVSPDGNVYLHWEFHRDEVYACSTMNARPFILNTPAPSNEGLPPPAAPVPTQERGPQPSSPNDARQGAFPALRKSHLKQSGT